MMSPASRAAKMITENRYLTLSTASSDGPWAAPINYALGPGRYLHYYSARKARHSQDVGDSSNVAAAIFNTQATEADVDGLQFTARCSVLHGGELAIVHQYYFDVNLTPEQRGRWLRPVSAFDEGGTWAFYRLDIQGLWVIDFESIERERLDSRILVDLEEMWEQVKSRTQGLQPPRFQGNPGPP
jgi:Pyridoxamine 5'-phosphate oxidase